MISGKAIPRLAEKGWSGSGREFGKDRLTLLERVARECGDIGLFHAWGRPIVLLNKAEYVHAVLNEHAADFDLPRVPPAVRVALGQGPFITKSRDAKHRKQRRLLQPAFQSHLANKFAETIVQCANQVQQMWKDGEVVSLQQELGRITAGSAGKIFFGEDLTSEAPELSTTITMLLDLLEAEMKQPLHWPLWIPTRHNRQVRRRVNQLDRIINRLIQKRRQSGAGGQDLLSLLLTARYDDGTPLSDVEVRDHATIILLSGYDEMAMSLTWTWWLLAKHAPAYERLIDEGEYVLGGRNPSLADLDHLPFTLQVYKEGLRLYGPADIIKPRIALREVELDGYRIRRGTRVIVSPHVLHRNPQYFPDPDNFEPERFSPDKEKQIPRHAYFPFGSGKHICMGKHFALLQGHLLLAAISQSVRFDLVEGQDVRPRAIYALRPRTDIKMRINRKRLRKSVAERTSPAALDQEANFRTPFSDM
jgi:cytochrome P450